MIKTLTNIKINKQMWWQGGNKYCLKFFNSYTDVTTFIFDLHSKLLGGGMESMAITEAFGGKEMSSYSYWIKFVCE